MPPSIDRRQFLQQSGAALASGMAARPELLSTSGSEPADRPNVLFIMADDHAANALGSYGSRLRDLAPTDHIDRLAEEGMRAENCFCTNAICVPSRASIVTGQYSHQNGVYTLADRLDPERRHVAHELQEAGYETALIGKWHLGSEPQGFDHWEVLPGQGRYHDPIMEVRGAGEQTFEGFSADVIADRSIEWLDRRDSGRPFCMMTHFKSAHGPWHYAPRHAELFEDVEIPEPATLWEDLGHRSSGSRNFGFTMDHMAFRLADITRGEWPVGEIDVRGLSREQRVRAGYQAFMKAYLRCIAAVDENVGRLLEELDRRGLAEDTLVVYTTDQGYFLGEHGYIDKRWMFEESLRMPLLARLPGEIPAGSVVDEIVLNTDLAPTLLDYAGRETPSYMQGRSAREVWRGEAPSDWRTSMYYRYWMQAAGASRPAHYGIRTERYKLIFYYGLPLDTSGGTGERTPPGWELYDLQRDPSEVNNVYHDERYRSVRERLKEELLAKKDELGDTDEQYPELMDLREKFW